MMNKRNILGMLFFLMLMSCSNKFYLEKKPILSFNESYYSKWTSGIQGGGSGFNVYVIIDKNIDVSKKDIEILGVYFKEKYCTLKYQKSNPYQCFIKNKENLETNSPDNKVVKNNDIDEKIPFSLKGNQAVVSYKVKRKQKYTKITLIKKETMDLPM